MSTLPLGLWLLQRAADFTELALVWLVQSTVIVLFAFAAGRLLARRGPALASAIYRTALVAVLACPPATLLISEFGGSLGLRLPAIEVVTLDDAAASENDVGIAVTAPATSIPVNQIETFREASHGPTERDSFVVGARPDAERPEEESSVPHAIAPNDQRAVAIATSSASGAERVEPAWRVRTGAAAFVVVAMLTWLGTALILFCRLLAGIRQAAGLVRRAVPVETAEQQICFDLARTMDLPAPRVMRSALVESPCLIGVFRPVILLPEEPLGIPLRAVLVHELAHLRRGDHVWNLAARSALSIFFFQPLLWRLVRQMEIAAEEVCDDHVLNFGADPTDYANSLLTLAEQSKLTFSHAGVPLVALRSLLGRRVQRILDRDAARSLRISRRALCTLLLAGLFVAALSGFASPRGKADAFLAGGRSSSDTQPENRGPDPMPPTAPAKSPARDEDIASDDPLPAGAIARLGTTRFRPGEGTQAVSFLPNKRTLVVTKSDGRLQYWESESGRFLREHRISIEEISAAAHTPDGRYIATRGMYWVALHDAQTGQEVLRHKLDDHIRGELISVADDGSVIAVGGSVRPIHRLIDVASGEAIDWPMNMATNALALSPDGMLLATAAPGLVRVWKWRESKEPRYFTIAHKNVARKADIRSLRFSPDASLLAVGIHDEAASLIDLATGEETGRLATEDGGLWQQLVFSPDGRLLATLTSSKIAGGVAVWDVTSGKLVQRLQTLYGGLSSIAFSPDGKWLAGVPWDSMLCVWNVQTGELLGRDLARHMAPPNFIQFFPGDERLATSGDDSTIHLWKLKSAEAEHVMRHDRKANEYSRPIRAMDVSPNGKYVASSCMADTVRIWEADTGHELHRLPGHGQLGNTRSVRFTPDGQRLLSWGDDMYVRVWDVRTGKKLQEYEATPAAAQIDERAKKLDIEGPRGSELGLRAGVFTQDASRLVVGLKAVHVFDVGSGRELLKFDYPKTPILWHLSISPDNRYLLLVGFGYEYEESQADGKPKRKTIHRAELRQLSDGKLVGELNREDGGESAAAISPDSRRAAITVGQDEPRVVIVNIPEMTEIARIDGFREPPRELEFSHSGKLLAVSNGDTSIVVYDFDKLAAQN